MILPENFKEHCKWTKKKYLHFGGNLGYRLYPKTISPLLQTSRRLRIFMLVLRDSSLYS